MKTVDRILKFIAENPGRSAWNIAKGIGLPSSSISSILCKLAKDGTVHREKWNRAWVYSPPPRSDVMADVQKMIEALQRDKLYGPITMYLPDESIRRMGGNPDDWPELEGYPGVRVIK